MTRLTGLSLPSRIRGWLVALEMGATPNLRPTAKEDAPTPLFDEVAERFPDVRERVGAGR